MTNRVRWRVVTLTYNVNGRRPNETALEHLLADENLSQGEFVAIGLQECPPSDAMGTVPPEFTWSRHITNWMVSRGCVLIKTTYLASNRLLLFTKPEILRLIVRVNFRYMRSTMYGLAGFKGSIAVRIEFGGDQASLCFVTSHLFHSEKFYWKRVEQYKSSYSQCTFEDKDSKGPKFVVWMGDLNWRVDTTTDAEKVAREVSLMEGNSKSLTTYLYENDQLKRAMVLRHAFHHLVEGDVSFPPTYRLVGDVSFPPTYRLVVGTTQYDLERVPSWCDRILYKEHNEFQLLRYAANTRIKSSDHFPVIAEFECTMKAPVPLELVRFLSLRIWYSGVPLSCRFRYVKSFWAREGSYKDWVGIYADDITDVDNPLKFVLALTTFDEMFNESFNDRVSTKHVGILPLVDMIEHLRPEDEVIDRGRVERDVGEDLHPCL
uniref:IPPc domain-containing protein n=1 Tax=Steinernema glaseri TaxID=37863 RepID=A0A1I7YD91_9BILA